MEIGGDREDLLEIVVDPQVLESYGVDYDQLATLVRRNNQLVAAGSLDNGQGRMAIKVPGVVENVEDVMAMPVKVSGDQVVTSVMWQCCSAPSRTPTGLPESMASLPWYWKCPSGPAPISWKLSRRFAG